MFCCVFYLVNLEVISTQWTCFNSSTRNWSWNIPQMCRLLFPDRRGSNRCWILIFHAGWYVNSLKRVFVNILKSKFHAFLKEKARGTCGWRATSSLCSQCLGLGLRSHLCIKLTWVLRQLISFHVLYKEPGQLIPLFHDPYLKLHFDTWELVNL